MQQPTAVLVFGILNILFGGFNLLVLPVQLLYLYGDLGRLNPLRPLLEGNPAFAWWMEVSTWLGGIVSVVLLASGIGLLFLKPWSRTLSIAYGVFAILMSAVGMAVSLVVFVPVMRKQIGDAGGPENSFFIFGMVGAIFGGCIGVLYPVLMLYFLTRPAAVAAFRPAPDSGELPA